MSAAEVKDAMRLAGQSSTSRGDWSVAGLGLKTASLSQCRTLTVVSKKAGDVSAYQWSLDHPLKTRKWALIELSDAEIQQLPRTELLSPKHGTLVLWQDLDYFG